MCEKTISGQTFVTLTGSQNSNVNPSNITPSTNPNSVLSSDSISTFWS